MQAVDSGRNTGSQAQAAARGRKRRRDPWQARARVSAFAAAVDVITARACPKLQPATHTQTAHPQLPAPVCSHRSNSPKHTCTISQLVLSFGAL